MDFSALQAVASDGIVSRAAAARVGISDHWLGKWVRQGKLARLARGVYALGEMHRPAHDPAVIATSWRVVLSHFAAAAWWGVDMPRVVCTLHVTAPRNRNRPRVAGIRMHRVDLAEHEVIRVGGVAVTSPLRTALDLARFSAVDEAVAIIDAFMRKRLLRVADLRAAAEEASGPGSARLRQVVCLVDPNSGSILESLTRVLLWQNGLLPSRSQWLIRHPPTGWWGYVDFAWPQLKVVLECDGFEFHSSHEVFRSDRRRWSTLTRAGWRLAIVTWADVVGDPTYVVELVRDLLSAGADDATKQHTMLPRATQPAA